MRNRMRRISCPHLIRPANRFEHLCDQLFHHLDDDFWQGRWLAPQDEPSESSAHPTTSEQSS